MPQPAGARRAAAADLTPVARGGSASGRVPPLPELGDRAATKPPGNPATRQPGNPATRQPGNRASSTEAERPQAWRRRRYCIGGGVKSLPSAFERETKIRVAGAMHGIPVGLSARVGDTGQSPEAMSLLAMTITVVSAVVS
jgi:hypothetical protein